MKLINYTFRSIRLVYRLLKLISVTLFKAAKNYALHSKYRYEQRKLDALVNLDRELRSEIVEQRHRLSDVASKLFLA